MIQKHTLIKSTVILTTAGMLSRIIGFFYRIFLSRAIGAEGIGIYQLIFPIHALLLALSVSGIQTAISRFVSSRSAAGEEQGAKEVLLCGTFLSVACSLAISAILYRNAAKISELFLHEARCIPLLQILSFSLPFSAVHACIIGYYTGQKRASVPAISQLIEQLVRVASSILYCQIFTEKGLPLSPVIALLGMLTSEIAAVLYTGTKYMLHHPRKAHFSYPCSFSCTREILAFSLPLNASRICLTLFQSADSICIPFRLQLHGLSRSDALSAYGTLTGMALPLVLFPTAVTNALSVMLLPAVSEAQATGDRHRIASLSTCTIQSCLLLGICSTLFFLLTGNLCGTFLFHNAEAGTYILILCWLCPFLYLGTTLTGILNGLGSTFTVFLINMAALLIRLFFVWFVIPFHGIKGYLIGLLISQLLHSILLLFCLSQKLTSDV